LGGNAFQPYRAVAGVDVEVEIVGLNLFPDAVLGFARVQPSGATEELPITPR
jgi:hypothetical protein